MNSAAWAVRALFFAVLGLTAFAQEIAAPPTPPELITQSAFSKKASPALAASGPVQFLIGNPTDDEQLQLELINRARADAPAEALRILDLEDPYNYVQDRLTNVNTELMKQQFATNPPVAPLSFNAQLNNAARAHTQYLFDNALQSHLGPGPTDTLNERLNTAGYPFSFASENVFSFSYSSEIGHAGFEVDWNLTKVDGGMQNPPGHRNNIHNAAYNEIGIGVIWGTNTVTTSTNTRSVGPMIITQDFGRQSTAATYITGIAYYDINTNNFYDLGEGCGGVKVTVDGLNAFAITTASGGYSIPVPTNVTCTVRFNASGIPETLRQITLNGADNYKLDFIPPFVTPSVSAVPSISFSGVSNLYTLTPLGGATGYRAKVQKLSAITLEGAEGTTPLTNFTLTKIGSYNEIPTNVKATGSRSFHLAHTNGIAFPGLQILEFKRPIFVKTGGKIDFKSRLGVASSNQIARVEVSEDRATWTSVWSQIGNQISGQSDKSEKTFNARTASLTNYLNKIIYVRFSFGFAQLGTYFPLTGAGTDAARGWYVDDITFANLGEPDAGTITDAGAEPAFRFTPPTTGEFIVSVQALNGARTFPFGTLRMVTAQANPPTLTLINNPTGSGGNVSFEFTVTGTVTPYALDSSATPNGPWTHEPGAIFTGPAAGRYTVTVASNGTLRFYRVRAN